MLLRWRLAAADRNSLVKELTDREVVVKVRIYPEHRNDTAAPNSAHAGFQYLHRTFFQMDYGFCPVKQAAVRLKTHGIHADVSTASV
ncbi:hypothetical protein D3C80_1230860 [compost metagenome]